MNIKYIKIYIGLEANCVPILVGHVTLANEMTTLEGVVDNEFADVNIQVADEVILAVTGNE